jgi:hypothetical protein
MNDISVDIDVDKIDIDKSDIDKNNVDKIFIFDDEPHNGKPITNIEVSPKGKYLVTFSKEDLSFVGWNVEDLDKGQIKLDNTIQIDNINVGSDKKTIQDVGINSLCVSDDKKLVYTYPYNFDSRRDNEGK